MKRIIILSITIYLIISGKSYSQESYSIMPIQAGTINFSANKQVINLSDELQKILKDVSLSATYYVIFTPVENTPVPSISNKTINSFTAVIQSKNNLQTNGVVDYVIFLKRKLIQMSTSKSIKRSEPNN